MRWHPQTATPHGVAPNARRTFATLLALTLTSSALGATFAHASPPEADRPVPVIVRTAPDGEDAAGAAVERLGGEVTRRLDTLDTVVASVPTTAVAALESTRAVVSVTPDARLTPLSLLGDTLDTTTSTLDATVDTTTSLLSSGGCTDLVKCSPESAGSVKTAAYVTKAAEAWKLGYTGKGVDVALIDTGVTNVPGLSTPGKVIDGPDLSFDGQDPALAHEDGYGHGTHLAGIIAGRDATVVSGREHETVDSRFIGIAPDARLVDVKVGARDGAVDVSQVLAAIDWVVEHRSANGMNIRVLNLAFGTNGVQSYVLDPLTHAVEVAWNKGIVVVVAAGNSGHANGQLHNPAYDPFILAVGASDPNGTHQLSDDTIPAFSSRGDGVRNPDIVAPGASIESLLAPDSAAAQHASARVGQRLIKGSGTSQAAAMVSGMAALVVQAHPNANPDQVKLLLKDYATTLPAADPIAQGKGLPRVRSSVASNLPNAKKAAQSFTPATGTGLLELARGDAHVVSADGVELRGEMTVTGSRWSGSTWSGSRWSGSRWSGSTWSGSRWSTGSWLGSTWSGSTWSGSTWSGSRWSGSTWSGSRWSSAGWLGVRWG